MPYASQMFKPDVEVAEILDSTVADICRYINDAVKTYLPKECEQIKTFCDMLPLNHSSTLYPFSSFAINIQVSTKPYRNSADKILYLIVPWAEMTEGEQGWHKAS